MERISEDCLCDNYGHECKQLKDMDEYCKKLAQEATDAGVELSIKDRLQVKQIQELQQEHERVVREIFGDMKKYLENELQHLEYMLTQYQKDKVSQSYAETDKNSINTLNRVIIKLDFIESKYIEGN